MPSYDFVCQDCGEPYEVRLSMSAYAEGEGRQCPKCGSSDVERTFTAVNVIAGSGSGASYASSASSCSSGSGFT